MTYYVFSGTLNPTQSSYHVVYVALLYVAVLEAEGGNICNGLMDAVNVTTVSVQSSSSS